MLRHEKKLTRTNHYNYRVDKLFISFLDSRVWKENTVNMVFKFGFKRLL